MNSKTTEAVGPKSAVDTMERVVALLEAILDRLPRLTPVQRAIAAGGRPLPNGEWLIPAGVADKVRRVCTAGDGVVVATYPPANPGDQKAGA